MKQLTCLLLLLHGLASYALENDTTRTPFEGMDLTWINGQNRQKDFPLTLADKKTGETILTGAVFMDGYFNYDLNRPIDNTHTVSSSIGRSNEFCVNQASVGLESNYRNMIGRLLLQFGQMGSIVQDVDGSVAHGRNTSVANLKFIREAAAGYHFNKWHGINVELGMFMSYIGLESYLLNENWSYQRSMACEFTPFYFTGARIQAFPSKKVKTELWLLNGWQSYNSFNSGIGIGSSTYWRPNENLQLVANFYIAGRDTRNNPDLLRFHHDNSVVKRYLNRPDKKGISQGAFSINNHYGFQTGNGIKPAQQYMLGTSVANRIWFHKNKMAVTLRGDYVTNPGLYLAFTPSPVTANDFTTAIAKTPNQKLDLYQGTATFDVMPNDYFTFRIEYGYRHANVPYFAGRGGTTSPDGWIDTPTSTWKPDLVQNEHRITVAMSFRL